MEKMLKDFVCFSRACAHCGALWGKTDLFCEGCWRLCEDFFSEKLEFPEYPFTAKTLFRWEKDELRSLKSQLLLSLKGGGLEPAVARLAWYFAQRDTEAEAAPRIFVPAPAKTAGAKDHAFRWAHALADRYGGAVHPVLSRQNEGEQKGKTLAERRQSQMGLLGGFDPGGREVVFVDDLIASGNTVIAAFAALNRPKKFSAWAIAHRPKQV